MQVGLIFNVYQDSGSSRSRLTAAFNRWRLNTCNATRQETDSSANKHGKGREKSSSVERNTPYGEAMIQNMQIIRGVRKAPGSTSVQQDVHDLILVKEAADQPLGSELCEIFEREMLEKITSRQAENNAPFCPVSIF